MHNLRSEKTRADKKIENRIKDSNLNESEEKPKDDNDFPGDLKEYFTPDDITKFIAKV